VAKSSTRLWHYTWPKRRRLTFEEEAHVEEEAPKKLDRLSSEDDSEEKGAP
jgi:hypothetical protein